MKEEKIINVCCVGNALVLNRHRVTHERRKDLKSKNVLMPIQPDTMASSLANELSISEAFIKTLTPQPEYLLENLTPLPMETLDPLSSNNQVTTLHVENQIFHKEPNDLNTNESYIFDFENSAATTPIKTEIKKQEDGIL